MPESIRLFALCEAMNWAHLPVAGGLYDQHPRLLEEWHLIFERRAAHEARKHAKEKSKQGNADGGQVPRKRSSRRR